MSILVSFHNKHHRIGFVQYLKTTHLLRKKSLSLYFQEIISYVICSFHNVIFHAV